MKPTSTKILWAVMICLLVVLGAEPRGVGAQSSHSLTVQAQAAFEGVYKFGEWLPIWVEVTNNGSDLEVEIQVRIERPSGSVTFALPISLPAGAHKLVPIYVLANNYSQELAVDLVSADGLVERVTVEVEPIVNMEYLIGLIAPEREGLAFLSNLQLPGNSVRPIRVVEFPLDQIPERNEGLASFDALIINDTDTSGLTPPQLEALSMWVERGGRLVLGGGAGAQQTLAGFETDMVPFAPTGVRQVDPMPALAAFAGAEANPSSRPVSLVDGEVLDGSILASAEGYSMVIEQALGRGYIDVITIDVAGAPFSEWLGTTSFWERLLTPGSLYPTNAPPDMSPRQIMSNAIVYPLTNMPSLDLPSVRGLGITLIAYILLVGPVNYLVLRRLKRLHFAWLTIPGLTIAFTIGAFSLSYIMRGSDLLLNKISILVMHPNQSMHVSSYLGLFSPAQQRYEVEVEGGGLIGPFSVQYDPWQFSGGLSVPDGVFVQGDPAHVRGLPIEQWSMQSFMTEGRWDQLGEVASDLTILGNQVSGWIENRTGEVIESAHLVFMGTVQTLGDLEPGQRQEVAFTLQSLDPFGSNLSWQLVQYDYSGDYYDAAWREVERRQGILDAVFGNPGAYGALAGYVNYGIDPNGVFLIGWLDEAPPYVQVEGRPVSERTTALLIADMEFELGPAGEIHLPTGTIPGTLVAASAEASWCGMRSTSAYLPGGEVIFEYRLPDVLTSLQLPSLHFNLETDGARTQGYTVEFYDWTSDAWAVVEQPHFGLNIISQAESYINNDGLIRARLTVGENSWGCWSLDLGIDGNRGGT
ncbi:MAG: hypothetical protein PVG63_00590 [Anaerolineales bacterium]|jgi:hypothetical protein